MHENKNVMTIYILDDTTEGEATTTSKEAVEEKKDSPEEEKQEEDDEKKEQEGETDASVSASCLILYK